MYIAIVCKGSKMDKNQIMEVAMDPTSAAKVTDSIKPIVVHGGTPCCYRVYCAVNPLGIYINESWQSLREHLRGLWLNYRDAVIGGRDTILWLDEYTRVYATMEYLRELVEQGREPEMGVFADEV